MTSRDAAAASCATRRPIAVRCRDAASRLPLLLLLLLLLLGPSRTGDVGYGIRWHLSPPYVVVVGNLRRRRRTVLRRSQRTWTCEELVVFFVIFASLRCLSFELR